MKKYILFLILILISVEAQSANWFVRQNGSVYGSANGTDWTNAWAGFGGINYASVACGDTIWAAGGTYTVDLVPNKVCTAGNALTIARARSDASAATSASGWSAGFDSTVTFTTGAIDFNGNSAYIVIDGRTSASPANFGSYGIVIDKSSSTSGSMIKFEASKSNPHWIIEYVDCKGPAVPGSVTFTGDMRCLNAVQAPGDASNGLLSHVAIHGMTTGVMFKEYTVPLIFEYIDEYDIDAANSGTFHPNGIYMNTASSILSNITIRYSRFRKGPGGSAVGEGIFCAGSATNSECDNVTIYGTLFYNLTGNSGLKSIQSRIPGTMKSLKVFNNSFYNDINPLITNSQCDAASEVRNNNFILTTGQRDTGCGTQSNNLVQNSPDPFVSSSGSNFHIVSNIGAGYPRDAGTSEAGTFTLDQDGNTFGADGNWDIGAYEYATSTGQMYVTPSTDLSSSGSTGGPFSPTSQAYVITNTESNTIGWSVTSGTQPTPTWLTISATTGSVAGTLQNPNASSTVTVSINSNANSLAAGSYSDSLVFANTTDGNVTTTLNANLTVNFVGGGGGQAVNGRNSVAVGSRKSVSGRTPVSGRKEH